MDTAAIATIASTTVALLVPYLKMFGEEFAKKAGETLGEKASETALLKTKELYDAVKVKFISKRETKKVLSKFEKTPDDEDTQAAIRFYLKEIMTSDQRFAHQLADTLREASEAGADTVFHTTIFGNVQKLVQMGNVYGDVRI